MLNVFNSFIFFFYVEKFTYFFHRLLIPYPSFFIPIRRKEEKKGVSEYPRHLFQTFQKFVNIKLPLNRRSKKILLSES